MKYVHKWLYEDVDIRSDVFRKHYPNLVDLESSPSSNIVRKNLQ